MKQMVRKLRREAEHHQRQAEHHRRQAQQLARVADILDGGRSRNLSAASRRRISLAQKARWAASRKKPVGKVTSIRKKAA